jgi:hypothetical protein
METKVLLFDRDTAHIFRDLYQNRRKAPGFSHGCDTKLQD